MYFLFIFACIFGSRAESPVRLVDPLLNTYSDYEDSIYGKSLLFLNQDLYRLLRINLLFILQGLHGVLVNHGSLHLCPMMEG